MGGTVVLSAAVLVPEAPLVPVAPVLVLLLVVVPVAPVLVGAVVVVGATLVPVAPGAVVTGALLVGFVLEPVGATELVVGETDELPPVVSNTGVPSFSSLALHPTMLHSNKPNVTALNQNALEATAHERLNRNDFDMS